MSTTIRTFAGLLCATTLGAGLVPALAQSASAAEAAATTAAAPQKFTTRHVDIDGDGRADTVTFQDYTHRGYRQTFMLTVKTAHRTASMPVVIDHEFKNRWFGAADVFLGTAPADGVAGHEILLDHANEVGDFSHLKTYTWRNGRLVQLAAPPTDVSDGSWRALYPYFGVDAYAFSTKAGQRYVAHTALRRSASGRYYGTTTTYVWSNGWAKKGTSKVSGITARAADAIPLWTGIRWR